jgi:hypothetical protein
MNAITLTQAYANYHSACKSLADLRAEFDKKQNELNAEIVRNQNIINLAENSLDYQKVQIAETIIYASKYTGEGDQKSCITDAIKQFVSGEPIRKEYQDLWIGFFGTKNYDRWSSQRSDHSYYCKPRHGYTNFEIGLTRPFRDSKRAHSDLTLEEIEAVVYYLTNLENIQKFKEKVDKKS